MYTYLDGKTPFYFDGEADYYVKYVLDGVLVTRANRLENKVVDLYTLDGDRKLQPIDNSRVYEATACVERCVNQILLFHSRVSFFSRGGYAFHAQIFDGGVYVTLQEEISARMVAVFLVGTDNCWYNKKWEPNSPEETAHITELVPKAQRSLQQQISLC